MKIACKKIRIGSFGGSLILEVGMRWQNGVISHITFDSIDKIVIVRDENNFVRLYNYKYIEVDPIMPFPQKGMNVRNLIY